MKSRFFLMFASLCLFCVEISTSKCFIIFHVILLHQTSKTDLHIDKLVILSLALRYFKWYDRNLYFQVQVQPFMQLDFNDIICFQITFNSFSSHDPSQYRLFCVLCLFRIRKCRLQHHPASICQLKCYLVNSITSAWMLLHLLMRNHLRHHCWHHVRTARKPWWCIDAMNVIRVCVFCAIRKRISKERRWNTSEPH